MSLLDADDLAYMREAQTETRPTAAELRRRSQGPTPSGGRGDTWQDPEPVDVRLDGKESNVPDAVTAILGSTEPVKVTMDLVEVRAGDTITVSATEVYQVVTDGDPDDWATAQIVWAKRIVWPVRA